MAEQLVALTFHVECPTCEGHGHVAFVRAATISWLLGATQLERGRACPQCRGVGTLTRHDAPL